MSLDEKYLNSLNDRQKEAVINTEGPMLVIAGAGSGKTKVLTTRIAYLIREKNIAPWNIIAITFTNRAATEMKERLEGIIGKTDADNTWVSTFHSSCVRMLRRDIDKIGYTKSFTIYDDSDKKKLVRQLMKKCNMDEKQIKPRSVMNYISDCKNRFVNPSEAKLEAENYINQKKSDVYYEYEKELKNNNALDFDDLLVKTLELLTSDKEVLEYYQNKFKYILVDEYQDTNKVQYLLVKLLAYKNKNIFVVGDDDQSIYGWRGADITNILNFEKDYESTKTVRLEQNYRSTNSILKLANEVIKNNLERKDKNLWSENGDGQVCKIYSARNEYDEARFVADEIKKLIDEENYKYKDFAIMYRTNAQSRVIEEAVSKYMMPYQVYGSVRFYDRKEVKDLIAYLNVIVNDKDGVSCERIINIPKRKIGDTSIEKIQNVASETNESFYNVLKNVKVYPELSKIAAKVTEFVDLIEELKELNKENHITELLKTLIEKINFEELLKDEADNDDEAEERIANVNELVNKIAYFEENTEEPTLEKFLADVMLMTDSDNLEEEDNRLKLMTIHTAKGLEFRTVFVVGFEDGLFPSAMCEGTESEQDEMEEERRLLYVAITRAKETLYVSYANQRSKFGRPECAMVSRFFREFPNDLFERINETKKQTFNNDDMYIDSLSNHEGYERKPEFARVSSIASKPKISDLTLTVSKDDCGFKAGDIIVHKKFGKGEVKEINSLSSGTGMTILFEEAGEKKFILNSIVLNLIKKI